MNLRFPWLRKKIQPMTETPFTGLRTKIFPAPIVASVEGITRNEIMSIHWKKPFYAHLPFVRVEILPAIRHDNYQSKCPEALLEIGRFCVGWIPPHVHDFTYTFCRVFYLDALAPFIDGGFAPIPAKYVTENMIETKSIVCRSATMKPWRKREQFIPLKLRGPYNDLIQALAHHRSRSIDHIYRHTYQKVFNSENPYSHISLGGSCSH